MTSAHHEEGTDSLAVERDPAAKADEHRLQVRLAQPSAGWTCPQMAEMRQRSGSWARHLMAMPAFHGMRISVRPSRACRSHGRQGHQVQAEARKRRLAADGVYITGVTGGGPTCTDMGGIFCTGPTQRPKPSPVSCLSTSTLKIRRPWLARVSTCNITSVRCKPCGEFSPISANIRRAF